jgi:serine/threonine-protein kinase HipA
MPTEVEVVASIAGENVLAGRLWSHRSRSRESATFSYEESYLVLGEAYELDPRLPLMGGPQQTAHGQEIFAAFSDSAPDGWGRRLIKRGEGRRADAEGRSARSIGEIDYLLGVRDDLRQGALRFRYPGGGDYLATELAAVPDLVELPRLLNAAERLERDEVDEPELEALLRGGSSLGGARPKVHVRDQSGRVAIAKFPSESKDEWDVMAWESIALGLAAAAGIDVPAFSLHRIAGRSVLIVDRFDRAGELRIGYVSAMTMLEASDGDQGSYLEIADVIERQSPTAARDLAELWRRIAFTVAISNTDDHLRNHGFLHSTSAGWSLSPAFDLNPNPEPGPKHLSTAIDFGNPGASFESLMEVAPSFRLDATEAIEILGEVDAARSGWRQAAIAAGCSAEEIARMTSAFETEQTEVAARLIAGADPDRF